MINKDWKIAIVGLGVLGGSYAEAFHTAGYTHITGIDINEESVSIAKEKGWIENGGRDASLVQNHDLIVLCLYPHVLIEWLKENQNYIRSGTLVTDVTGVKRAVIEETAKILREDLEFIACHPMAGRESKGIQYADASRFQNANFIIVPSANNSETAIDTMKEMAEILGFRKISILTPEEHDKMVGFLSQLTHVIAVSLMNVTDNTSLAAYTGDSFRDLTRIAKINEEMWPELFVLNKDYLVSEIDAFESELETFKGLLLEEDIEAMKEKMIISTERRKCFDKKED